MKKDGKEGYLRSQCWESCENMQPLHCTTHSAVLLQYHNICQKLHWQKQSVVFCRKEPKGILEESYSENVHKIVGETDVRESLFLINLQVLDS